MADIVPRDPFSFMDREFGSLRMALDRLMGESLLRGSVLDAGSMDIDIYERDGKTVVEASLPGFKREEIDVQLHEGVLSITAQHNEEHGDSQRNYYRRERRFGHLTRRIPLPASVRDDHVNAQFKDGVLRIELDVPPEAAARPIEVKEG